MQSTYCASNAQCCFFVIGADGARAQCCRSSTSSRTPSPQTRGNARNAALRQ
ncbi:hypothetical protein HMPREF1584_00804, partial [Gardnerella vaginalis JCP8481A]